MITTFNDFLNENIENDEHERVVFICPVEGEVKNRKDCAFEYRFKINGERLKLHIINYSYITEKPIHIYIDTDFDEIRKCFEIAISKGDDFEDINTIDELNEMLIKFPDYFIETVAYILNYQENKPKWIEYSETKTD